MISFYLTRFCFGLVGFFASKNYANKVFEIVQNSIVTSIQVISILSRYKLVIINLMQQIDFQKKAFKNTLNPGFYKFVIFDNFVAYT